MQFPGPLGEARADPIPGVSGPPERVPGAASGPLVGSFESLEVFLALSSRQINLQNVFQKIS